MTLPVKNPFSLFQSHISLAHKFWQEILTTGDKVLDATCGNGLDTLKLAQLVLKEMSGKIWAIDIQPKAITKTKELLSKNLSVDQLQNVYFQTGCHSSFPSEIRLEELKLVVYNLGYLPGSNKELTTKLNSTLQSISKALDLIKPGGAISITCYPGHGEGEKELTAILDFTAQLSQKQWYASHHLSLNRKKAPSIVLIQKSF